MLVIVGLVTLLVRFDTLAVLHDNSHNRLMDWHISHTIECFWRITVDTSPLINKLCINIVADMASSEELAGVLMWAINGWKRLKENSYRFSSYGDNDKRLEFLESSNPVIIFLQEKC